MIKKIITGIGVSAFIITGLVDAIINDKPSYSTIMGFGLTRYLFYTIFLLIIGCWLLYHRWYVGIGFLSLAAFGSFFDLRVVREIDIALVVLNMHNYFASVMIYIGIILDIVTRKKFKWLIPFIVFGIIQAVSFEVRSIPHIFVLCMEASSLIVGTIFVLKSDEWTK